MKNEEQRKSMSNKIQQNKQTNRKKLKQMRDSRPADQHYKKLKDKGINVLSERMLDLHKQMKSTKSRIKIRKKVKSKTKLLFIFQLL